MPRTPAGIDDPCRRIVQAVKPENVALFGSYAHGKPTPEADVDLLAMTDYRASSGRASADVLHRTRPAFGVGILVRTPAEVAERLAMDDHFMRDVVERAEVLYAADHE